MLTFPKINIMHVIRNALNNFNNISELRYMKKPSLHKLGFLVDHSSNTLVFHSILIFIDKLILKMTAMNQRQFQPVGLK